MRDTLDFRLARFAILFSAALVAGRAHIYRGMCVGGQEKYLSFVVQKASDGAFWKTLLSIMTTIEQKFGQQVEGLTRLVSDFVGGKIAQGTQACQVPEIVAFYDRVKGNDPASLDPNLLLPTTMTRAARELYAAWKAFSETLVLREEFSRMESVAA